MRWLLTNAFAGVMRSLILRENEAAPSLAEVEQSLVRLVLAFASHSPSGWQVTGRLAQCFSGR